jgi:hypothetical protein
MPSIIPEMPAAPESSKRNLFIGGRYVWVNISEGIAKMMNKNEMDRGIPLPGSDKERRSRIRQEINLLKWYLLLYRIDEWRSLFPPRSFDEEWAVNKPTSVPLSIV